MSVPIRFTDALVTRLVLARVGHPQRDEPLLTSRAAVEVPDPEQPLLASILLKPFGNLTAHRFSHPSSLDQHELNACAAAIFANPDELLPRGIEIAKRLYAKSNHPAIKSGDLCIGLVEGVVHGNESVAALCILKSESVVPFLSISEHNGDLQLHTEQGINPEKIDKGALVLNRLPNKGYHVLTFDRAGQESRFWVRDFLGVTAISDNPFLTKQYADMALSFVKEEEQAKHKDDAECDAPPWDAASAARQALDYFENQEKFSLQEFEEKVLRTPESAARFARQRAQVEEYLGQKLPPAFDISKKDLNKARKHLGSVIRLDTGVEIHIKAASAKTAEANLDHGFDASKGMNFIKVFYNRKLT